jgi:hypothetical protein
MPIYVCIQFCSLSFHYYAQYKLLNPAPKDGFYQPMLVVIQIILTYLTKIT